MRLDPAGAVQSVTRQFGSEFVRLEPVFTRMDRERAEHPAVQHVAGDLLEQQQAAGSQHARNLGERLLPVRHVVDDPEVDDGVDHA